MGLARTVADVLTDHAVFEVECIDRMYLNVYLPGLQYAAGLVAYVHRQLDLPIASTAPLGRITDGFTAAMHRFARDQRVPWVEFVKGQRKDDIAHEHLAGFDRDEGVLFIGRAQEKTGLFRTEKRRGADGRDPPARARPGAAFAPAGAGASGDLGLPDHPPRDQCADRESLRRRRSRPRPDLRGQRPAATHQPRPPGQARPIAEQRVAAADATRSRWYMVRAPTAQL